MRLFGFSLIASSALIAGATAYAMTQGGAHNDMPIAAAAVEQGKLVMSAEEAPMVMVELFTSQGCSSCPPADAVAARLARDPNVVVVSRPVTYWDRLGWKDTLAREANTDLQRAYAAHGNANAGVYTPQVVINGEYAAVGSREASIRDLVQQAMTQVAHGAPELSIEDGKVRIAGKAGLRATVSILALSSRETVRIGRGENGGRSLTYTNVVIDEMPIGQWRGGQASFEIPAEALRVAGADRYALVVQEPRAGRVLAAKYI